MDNRKILFVAACLAMVLFGVACVAIGTINEYLTTAFSVDKIFIGFLASLFGAGALIGSVSFGPVVDRFGYKFILILSLLFLLIAFETIGRTDRLIIIQAMIFLLGLSGGIINGATSALVSDIYREERCIPEFSGCLLGYWRFKPSFNYFHFAKNGDDISCYPFVNWIVSTRSFGFIYIPEMPGGQTIRWFPIQENSRNAEKPNHLVDWLLPVFPKWV